MDKFRIFVSENRKEIFKWIGIVAAILIVIQILNWQAKQNKEEETSNVTIDYGHDVGIISNEKKSTNTYTTEKDAMQQFVDYCNNKEYENAYALLTDSCKEVLYPNINVFKSNYCDLNFGTVKTCAFQLWTGSTYKVEMRDDIMATGRYLEDEYIQDYYTLYDGKISIGGYLGRINVGEMASSSNVDVRVKNIDCYMEYTIVNVGISNNTDKDILVDPQKNEASIVLKDSNQVEYTANTSEKTEDDLIVRKGELKNIDFKFVSIYRDGLSFKGMQFKKIILDYAGYKENKNVQYTKINIEM